MKINTKFILAASIIFLFSCTGKSQKNKKGKDSSVETQKPNSNYQPAFEGQTRIKAVKTSTPYKVEVLNTDLGRPWGIINLPDGKFLITDKKGYMNVVSGDGKQISKISGFPKVDSKGQGGMLDVALDPGFTSNN